MSSSSSVGKWMVPAVIVGALGIGWFAMPGVDTGPDVVDPPKKERAAATDLQGGSAEIKRIDRPPWLKGGEPSTEIPDGGRIARKPSAMDARRELMNQDLPDGLRNRPSPVGLRGLDAAEMRVERARRSLDRMADARAGLEGFVERAGLPKEDLGRAGDVLDSYEGQMAELRAQIDNGDIDGVDAIEQVESLKQEMVKAVEDELGSELDPEARKAFGAPKPPAKLPVPPDATIVNGEDFLKGEPLDW